VEGASATKLHVKANQSYLLDTDLRIRRVSIGKPEIADVTVVTPKQIMVTGRPPAPRPSSTGASGDPHLGGRQRVDGERRAAGPRELVPGEKFEMSGPRTR